MKIAAALAMVSAMFLAVVSPAFAQETTAEAKAETDGEFRLTLNGQAPDNFSFWVESTAPGIEGVICTTDAAMVDSGVEECKDGGAVNVLALTAPAKGSADYRILGSQGAALSQSAISQGSVNAEDGFVVNAEYTFADSGTAPNDQYSDGSSKGTPDSGAVEGNSNDPTGGTGVLPDTGGASLLALAGASLLIAAGGFLSYRLVR